VKHKPKATEEQVHAVLSDFAAFLEKCCKADDKEACFSEDVWEFVHFHLSDFHLSIWSG
jgi:hypothetical protein